MIMTGLKIFTILTTYEPKNKPKDEEDDKPSVNITRIDIALDDYDELVKFDDIEKKIEKGALSLIKTLV